VIHACAEVCDHLKLGAGPRDQLRINPVRHGGGQNIGRGQGVGHLFDGKGSILSVQLCVEQFAHPGLYRIRKFARHHDFRLAICHLRA
jgi:hypothetical protein